MVIRSKDLFHDSLQGPESIGINVPKITTDNYYDDNMVIFTANAKNISRSQKINISKPFYGYTLNDSVLVSGDELAKKGFALNAMAYTQIHNQSSVVYVRIPYIHNTSLALPDNYDSKSEYDYVLSMHTSCTLDPTIFVQNNPIRRNTLVKIQFLDESLRTAIIIGLAGAAFGAVTAFLQQNISSTAVPAGNYSTNVVPGKSCIIGDSIKESIYLEAIKSIEKYGGVDSDITVSSAGTRNAPAFAKEPAYALQYGGITTGDFYTNRDGTDKLYGTENGRRTPYGSLYQRLLRVSQDPEEKQKYANFVNVFFGTGRNERYSLQGSRGPFKVRSPNIANIPKLVELLPVVFPNARSFYILKGSSGWMSEGEIRNYAKYSWILDVGDPIIMEFYRRFYVDLFPQMKFTLLRPDSNNKEEGFAYNVHPHRGSPAVKKMGDIIARITTGQPMNQAEDFEDFANTDRSIEGFLTL